VRGRERTAMVKYFAEGVEGSEGADGRSIHINQTWDSKPLLCVEYLFVDVSGKNLYINGQTA
jgi:hypothetical protein